jgi:transposase
MDRHRLTDEQWLRIADLFGTRKPTGRPPNDRRQMLDGVLWVLNTGAPWRDLPAEFGKWSTAWDLFDTEHAGDGRFDPVRFDRVRRYVDQARERGLRVKMTFEHFRFLLPETHHEHNLPTAPFARGLYHHDFGGPFSTMADYLTSPHGHELFLRKVDRFAAEFADDPAIFGWELWNEMNCVHAPGWIDWTAMMLGEVQKRLPKHLLMQSLGSLDNEQQSADYTALANVAGNQVGQLHRYLDEGAAWSICHGPADVLAADAIYYGRSIWPNSPLLLAETGAVEPRHSEPWRLYAEDRAGTLLHDLLFAPFFAGASGSGQPWHWIEYLAQNDLWAPFGRFAAATDGINPPEEAFEPDAFEHEGLRVYRLQGSRTTLAWIRDVACDWRSELKRHEPPQLVEGVRLPLGAMAMGPTMPARVFDPWSGLWSAPPSKGGIVSLPPFVRSLIVRVDRTPELNRNLHPHTR